MFGAIDKTMLSKILEIRDAARFKINLVIALGKPKETVKLVDTKEDRSIKYYRNNENIHYVPKRELKDVLLTWYSIKSIIIIIIFFFITITLLKRDNRFIWNTYYLFDIW